MNRPDTRLSIFEDFSSSEEDFGLNSTSDDDAASADDILRRAERLEQVREPLAPLEITQPNGADFRVDGQAVSWQNWRFRVGFTPREGLVLHTLSFADGKEERPVVYRASLSELVVPYGDPAGDHYMNHSFDLGEGVFGAAVNSLTLGCDCVGEIYYFDVNMTDGHGDAF